MMSKVGTPEFARILVNAMKGNVVRATLSGFANFLVKKIVEVILAADTRFVAEEFLGADAAKPLKIPLELAMHKYGCRIYSALIVNTLEEETNGRLLGHFLFDAEKLCMDFCGNFVLRSLLDKGRPDHRRRIAVALLEDIDNIAGSKFGIYLLEEAIEFYELDDQRAFAEALLREPAKLFAVYRSDSKYGAHVVRKLCKLDSEDEKDVIVRELGQRANALISVSDERCTQALLVCLREWSASPLR